MALKAILDATEHGALGDSLKSEYVEKDGKFFLDVTPVDGFSLDDVNGLKASLGAERTNRTRMEKLVEKFKDLDPDVARRAITELEELKTIDPKKEADKLANSKFEAAKSQLIDKHNSELQDRDTRASKLTKKIETLLIDVEAVKEITNAKGSVELLLPHIRSSTRVREDKDDFIVEVVDKDGNGRIGDSKGAPMTIKDLVVEMRNSEAFGRAFDGDGTTGSGKRPGTPGGGIPTGGLKRSQMSPEQKRDYQQKHGQEAFLKLPR